LSSLIRGRLLEQNVFNTTSWEFWWYIKKFQLDMLIFVQVYRTIDKIWDHYKILEEQKRAKESTKRKLKASGENCSWSQSAPEVMTSSEASHQKLNITRSCSSSEDAKLKALKVVQWIQSRLSIAEDQKSETMANSNEFKGIRCLFFEERWQSTIVRSVQPLPPLLSFCLCYKTRITALPATMFLQTWNGFEIDLS